MSRQSYTITEAKAWIRHKSGTGEIIKIIPDLENNTGGITYLLYTAYEKQPEYRGRILFDAQGYWIYDGDDLAVIEQEQVARFIIHHIETI
ncbi:hypothetical protein [Mucilaginibacter boryungensis]|uniref:Uncharacterized protein n=1 Tax=Mucilaginibacter boryungensis TaxID=768480 RepID=A0ABR9XJP2_9SPHI|nr:hypothetical protein [Mucilaginibacter boryungensis]MBE9667613.1 hypothetical protein [Mucilaginibacter boryungensis]